jgi:rod shape-determining protein MreC
MFSKKLLLIAGAIALIVINIIGLSLTSSKQRLSEGPVRYAISIAAPFQDFFSHSTDFARNIWRHYFFLVSLAQENDKLRQSLKHAAEKNNQCKEIELANFRLRKLLNFKRGTGYEVVAAEVIGKDPSPWFKTVIINKGRSDGLQKGIPVVVPEGIVGQVVEVSNNNSKVLLIIDQNSAVDALVQRSRARGIIRGEAVDLCVFQFVLRKHDAQVGDVIVSSGLDGVFPKGLRVGQISEVIKRDAGIFQEVKVTPFVNFEKIEEVLIFLDAPDPPMDVKPPEDERESILP